MAMLLLAGGPCFADNLGLEELIRNSPFAEISLHERNGMAMPLEFRGFVYEDTGPIFSVYEAATHRSFWLHENENAGQFTVRHFDKVAATISVEYRGQLLDLALKKATVALQSATYPAAGPVPAMTAGQAVVPIDPLNTPEGQRELEQTREEIRRRRAMRQR
jgi:hypothetical protein